MAGRFNAIGDAIALAVKQATQINDKTGKINKRKRILVLLTDADQPTGEIEPDVAAQLAKNANLPLYTIAIGATSLAAEESRLGGLLYSPVDIRLVILMPWKMPSRQLIYMKQINAKFNHNIFVNHFIIGH